MAIASVDKIPKQIETALRSASVKTGVDFQYLLDTAARESGFRASVKAKTSSASGLFQFIESTWLQMVKDKGPELGLGSYAKHISKSSNGRYFVENSEKRQEILNLRNNPETASLMAGAFTKLNSQELTERVGRKPTPGELYIAHFLGAGNGAKLIKASAINPTMRADELFPKAAKANKALFYRDNNAVSAKHLYQNLVRRHHAQSVAIAEKVEKSAIQPKSHVAKVEGRPEILQGSILHDGGIGNFSKTAKDQLRGTVVEIDTGQASRNDKGKSDTGGVGVWQVFGGLLAQYQGEVKPLFADLDPKGKEVRKGPILETMEGVRGLFKRGGLG